MNKTGSNMDPASSSFEEVLKSAFGLSAPVEIGDYEASSRPADSTDSNNQKKLSAQLQSKKKWKYVANSIFPLLRSKRSILERFFIDFDQTKTGTITAAQFRLSLALLPLSLGLSILDYDYLTKYVQKDDQVNWLEFLEILGTNNLTLEQQIAEIVISKYGSMDNAFIAWGGAKDGHLAIKDMSRGFQTLELDLTEMQILYLTRKVDDENRGAVTMEKFVAALPAPSLQLSTGLQLRDKAGEALLKRHLGVFNAFRKVDRSGNNKISLVELIEGLRAVRSHLDDQQVQCIFDELHWGSDNTLDFKEFWMLFSAEKHRFLEDVLREILETMYGTLEKAFRSFNASGLDATISETQFRTRLQRLSVIELTYDEISEIWKRYKGSNGNTVDWTRFSKMFDDTMAGKIALRKHVAACIKNKFNSLQDCWLFLDPTSKGRISLSSVLMGIGGIVPDESLMRLAVWSAGLDASGLGYVSRDQFFRYIGCEYSDAETQRNRVCSRVSDNITAKYGSVASAVYANSSEWQVLSVAELRKLLVSSNVEPADVDTIIDGVNNKDKISEGDVGQLLTGVVFQPPADALIRPITFPSHVTISVPSQKSSPASSENTSPAPRDNNSSGDNRSKSPVPRRKRLSTIGAGGSLRVTVPSAVEKVIATALMETHATLMNAFLAMDTDNDGKITAEQIIAHARKTKVELEEEEVFSLMQDLGHKQLTYVEFVKIFELNLGRQNMAFVESESSEEIQWEKGGYQHVARALMDHFGSIHSAFVNFDKNNDERLSLQELLEGFETIPGITVSKKSALKLIKLLSNAQGFIAKPDFFSAFYIDDDSSSAAVSPATKVMQMELRDIRGKIHDTLCAKYGGISEAFQCWDEDGDKKLTVHEFAQKLAALDIGITDPQIISLVNACDDNRNNIIEIHEFQTLLTKDRRELGPVRRHRASTTTLASQRASNRLATSLSNNTSPTTSTSPPRSRVGSFSLSPVTRSPAISPVRSTSISPAPVRPPNLPKVVTSLPPNPNLPKPPTGESPPIHRGRSKTYHQSSSNQSTPNSTESSPFASPNLSISQNKSAATSPATQSPRPPVWRDSTATPEVADIWAKMTDKYGNLYASFLAFDLDGDGRVSQREMGKSLAKLGWVVAPSFTEELISTADSDKDGYLNYSEFVTLFSS